MNTKNPWIVDPTDASASKKIELSYVGPDGTVRPLWLSVKTELSEGEHRRMLKSISRVSQPVGKDAGNKDAEATFEWTDYSFARMDAYIIDWSLAHEAEASHRLPAARASYEKLRRDVFTVIDDALDAHEKALGTEKKVQPSRRKPSAMSA